MTILIRFEGIFFGSLWPFCSLAFSRDDQANFQKYLKAFHLTSKQTPCSCRYSYEYVNLTQEQGGPQTTEKANICTSKISSEEVIPGSPGTTTSFQAEHPPAAGHLGVEEVFESAS